MAFIYEIKDRLVAQGVGVYGTNILIGSKAIIPTGDGPYLSLTETGGTDSAKTQNNTATERPSAQVLVRAKSKTAADTMLRAAYNALGGANGVYNITINGVAYLSIVTQQTPTDIGLDGSGRVMVVFNIRAEKQPS